MRAVRLAGGFGALVTLLATGAIGTGATTLTDAQLSWTEEGGALLRLIGEGGFDPRHFVLDQPDRVVLDLVGVADPIGVSVPADGRFVKAVRCAPRPERDGRPVVRYVLETSAAPRYRIETSPGELRLLVAPALAGAPASPPASGASASPGAPAVAAASAGATAAPAVAAAPAPAPEARVAAAAPAPAAPPQDDARPQTAGMTAGMAVGMAAGMTAGSEAPQSAAGPHGATPRPDSAPVAQAPPVPAPSASRLPAAAPAGVAAPAAAPEAGPAGAPVAARDAEAALMSLDVQGADILTVLRSISDYAGVNIFADANVQGAVTVRAVDLPWPEMLASVCKALALEALDDGTVIRVATQKTAREEELARETAARRQEEYLPLYTRIIAVNYAHAEELRETLSKMVSPRGIIEFDKRTNALVVTDIGPRLEQIEGMVERLDTETIQVEITAKIVDVDATVSRQLGISWGLDNLHAAEAGASGSVGVSAADLVDPPGQMRVGLIRSFGELDAQLQALEQSNEAEIISTPRITTVNNRMARILVGKEVPLITLDYAGNAITELKKVGIALEVTPHINVGDRITMDIHPEVSDLSSQSTVTGGVVFTTTEADTRVLVENGQTAVIAGLMRSGETRFERGIPILKDLPILGHLFKTSDKRKEKRELLIFITPRIVRPGEVVN